METTAYRQGGNYDGKGHEADCYFAKKFSDAPVLGSSFINTQGYDEDVVTNVCPSGSDQRVPYRAGRPGRRRCPGPG
jgi:hypothetical protein